MVRPSIFPNWNSLCTQRRCHYCRLHCRKLFSARVLHTICNIPRSNHPVYRSKPISDFFIQWIGAKQEEFNMSSMQILYYQAPVSFVLLLILIPAYETYSSQLELLKNFSNIQMIVFIFSGVAAFTVNLTTYWIIKNTSGRSLTH